MERRKEKEKIKKVEQRKRETEKIMKKKRKVFYLYIGNFQKEKKSLHNKRETRKKIYITIYMYINRN